MTTKTLAAALAAATIFSATSAMAQTNPYATPAQRTWLENSQWMVWSDRSDGGQKSCFIKRFEPTTAGIAYFGMAQSDTKNAGMFMYGEPTWGQTIAGYITLQIDDYTPWRVTAQNSTQGALNFSLGTNPLPFVQQLETGAVLRITTTNGTRAFSLSGSGAAINTMLSCIDSIAQERQQAVAPLAPAVPHLPPLAPVVAPQPAYRTL